MKISGKTQEQVDTEKLGKAEKSARLERNRKLSDCDWTQVSDAPVDHKAWALYRQALRDITKQAGWPTDIQWPEEP